MNMQKVHNVLARLRRGWDRLWAAVIRKFRNSRPATTGHTETARETRTMLGLMASATAAGAEMTDEQRLLLIQAAPGMRAREAVLLGIPNRSSVEENELHMIRREMAAIEGRDEPPAAPRIQGFLGAGIAASPLIAILGSPLTWIAAGVAAFGVQTARITHLHHELTDARGAARQNAEAARTWEERAHAYEHATEDAAAAARITTATLESERARARAAAARERRRQDELRQVDAGGAPPAWERSLRGDAAAADQPGPATPAADSDPSGVRH